VEFCGYKAGENKEREEAERDKKKVTSRKKKGQNRGWLELGRERDERNPKRY
jgi:hypothetical protein